MSHSEAYFGETRDAWWNHDYLSLLARRWQLSEARAVLDVGAGVGHWGRAISAFLPDGARVVGVEREPRWVAEAAARTPKSPVTFDFVLGAAEALPFPESSFDLVTCQTLLIHVRDPLHVIREMLRVTRPGGLILLVEPNNLAASLSIGCALTEQPLGDIATLFQFQLMCERGKAALGEGNNSIGELIPGLLAQAGAITIEVRQSDKAFALMPPYESREQEQRAKEAQTFAEREFWIWDRVDTQRYFLAGGGSPSDFDEFWSLALKATRETAQGLKAKTFHAAGGATTYLVCGRKRK